MSGAHLRLCETVLALPAEAGAEQGRLVQQYDEGKAGRAREIDEGAQRPAEAIRRDVVETSEAVDRAFADSSDHVWLRPILLGSGKQRAASHLVSSRWREVEVHHVDLGLGYTHLNWDSAFIDRFLPAVLTSLAERTKPAELLAWGLGRADAPDLQPWG